MLKHPASFPFKPLPALVILVLFAGILPASAQRSQRLNTGWEFVRQDLGGVWEAVRPVGKGNPYWYKLPSGLFTPADNFFNNGQTSGQLEGTPQVDTAVPAC